MSARSRNRMVSSAGVTLAVAESGDPQSPPVVLVHGYPDTKEVWRPVIDLLADRFHVIAYDVRGAGASSAPRGRAAYRLERLADDFDAVTAATAGGRPVHLVGHDWGGIQGWEFVTDERFRGRIASFTSIAGPALAQARHAARSSARSGHVVRAAGRLRRSWYIAPLCLPGGPALAWRVLLSPDRWRRTLAVAERLPPAADHPAETVCADGRHGANLYRANIPRRLVSAPVLGEAHAPVQLVVPSGDRFISESYYDAARQVAPGLWRRTVAGSHWAQRSHPELIATWVEEFAAQAADGVVAGHAPAPRRWIRGGGVQQLAGALTLVTGAASGIGLATAQALARHGARVLIVDRDGEAAARAARGLPDARPLVCDVADASAMERLAVQVLGEEGVPDIVVNNAGIGVAGRFVDTSAEDWRAIVDVNLLGVVHGGRLFARAMIERGGGGHIVNTASAAAFLPAPSLTAYSATKAAVLMLTEGMRAELAPHGIGVTAVCPGIVATGITAATRYVGLPADEQARTAERVTRLYERRNFGPERVAEAIVAAIAADRPLAIVTPEAKAMRAISRLSPRLGRRLAALPPL